MGRELTGRTNWFRNRKGQSIIELTLLTPLILVALMIPVDFGMGFFTAHFTQNAVREAARIATTLPDCSGGSTPCVTAGTVPLQSCPATDPVIQAACDRLPNLLAGAQVGYDFSGAVGATCMRTVTVTASGLYNYGFAYGLLNLIRLPGWSPIPTSATISRATEMRYEFQSIQYSNPC